MSIKHNVSAQVEKHRVIEFEGYKIEIINRMMEELILVDDVVIVKKTC